VGARGGAEDSGTKSESKCVSKLVDCGGCGDLAAAAFSNASFCMLRLRSSDLLGRRWPIDGRASELYGSASASDAFGSK
jgi:hypothetical protein